MIRSEIAQRIALEYPYNLDTVSAVLYICHYDERITRLVLDAYINGGNIVGNAMLTYAALPDSRK